MEHFYEQVVSNVPFKISQSDVKNIWNNAWEFVRTTLSTGRGVHINDFGDFSFRTEERKELTFVISESFCRSYNINGNKGHLVASIPTTTLSFQACTKGTHFDRVQVRSVFASCVFIIGSDASITNLDINIGRILKKSNMLTISFSESFKSETRSRNFEKQPEYVEKSSSMNRTRSSETGTRRQQKNKAFVVHTCEDEASPTKNLSRYGKSATKEKSNIRTESQSSSRLSESLQGMTILTTIEKKVLCDRCRYKGCDCQTSENKFGLWSSTTSAIEKEEKEKEKEKERKEIEEFRQTGMRLEQEEREKKRKNAQDVAKSQLKQINQRNLSLKDSKERDSKNNETNFLLYNRPKSVSDKEANNQYRKALQAQIDDAKRRKNEENEAKIRYEKECDELNKTALEDEFLKEKMKKEEYRKIISDQIKEKKRLESLKKENEEGNEFLFNDHTLTRNEVFSLGQKINEDNAKLAEMRRQREAQERKEDDEYAKLTKEEYEKYTNEQRRSETEKQTKTRNELDLAYKRQIKQRATLQTPKDTQCECTNTLRVGELEYGIKVKCENCGKLIYTKMLKK